MKSDGVSTAFAIIMDEIAAVEAQLNQEGINAFKNSEYSQAKRLSESGKALGTFRGKLEALRQEWSSGIDLSTRERVKVEPSYTGGTHSTHNPSPKTVLRITMPSGRVIQRPTAAQAMVDAIEAFGISQVATLGHKLSGVDLISKSKHPKYGQTPLGRFYVFTHTSTASKKKLLLQIAAQLGQVIKVEVIAP